LVRVAERLVGHRHAVDVREALDALAGRRQLRIALRLRRVRAVLLLRAAADAVLADVAERVADRVVRRRALLAEAGDPGADRGRRRRLAHRVGAARHAGRLANAAAVRVAQRLERIVAVGVDVARDADAERRRRRARVGGVTDLHQVIADLVLRRRALLAAAVV